MANNAELDNEAAKFVDRVFPCTEPCGGPAGCCRGCLSRLAFHAGYNYGVHMTPCTHGFNSTEFCFVCRNGGGVC